MRNQFVGDINDYHKYRLLNELSQSCDVNVCWMLNDDVDGQDSRFVKQKLDDPLAVFLRGLVETGSRNITEIEGSDLIKVNHYYRQVEDICVDEISGILFFDPDNGIQVKSLKKDDRRYLYYRDIKRFISYVDILVYQHFPRVPRQEYMKALSGNIIRTVGCSEVIHFPKSMVDFILIKK